MSGPRIGLRIRDIVAADLPAITEILTRGFPSRSRAYWLRGLERHAKRSRPEGYPTFGYCLDNDGVPVGIVLLLFSEVLSAAQTVIRCNVSSWYIEPEFRTFGSLLVTSTTRDRNVTYFNISPAPHTWSAVEAQGFSVYCKGQMYGLLALSSVKSSVTVELFSEQAGTGLGSFELNLLRQHASVGCLSIVVRDNAAVLPFVFQKHYLKNFIPVYRLIYCRDLEEFQHYAGNIGRFLARRGGLLVQFDANGPIKGIAGWRSEKRGRKYAKGANPPSLGDLAFTEAALFDS